MDEDKKETLVRIMVYEDLLGALKDGAEGNGSTNYRIAKDSGLPQITVERIMDAKSEAKISTLLSMFTSLGIEVYVKPKATK